MHPQMAVYMSVILKQKSVLTPTFSEKTGQKRGVFGCFLGEIWVGFQAVKLWGVGVLEGNVGDMSP